MGWRGWGMPEQLTRKGRATGTERGLHHRLPSFLRLNKNNPTSRFPFPGSPSPPPPPGPSNLFVLFSLACSHQLVLFFLLYCEPTITLSGRRRVRHRCRLTRQQRCALNTRKKQAGHPKQRPAALNGLRSISRLRAFKTWCAARIPSILTLTTA